MWCIQFIIIYDCNNYGNNNDNLDRARFSSYFVVAFVTVVVGKSLEFFHSK